MYSCQIQMLANKLTDLPSPIEDQSWFPITIKLHEVNLCLKKINHLPPTHFWIWEFCSLSFCAHKFVYRVSMHHMYVMSILEGCYPLHHKNRIIMHTMHLLTLHKLYPGQRTNGIGKGRLTTDLAHPTIATILICTCAPVAIFYL